MSKRMFLDALSPQEHYCLATTIGEVIKARTEQTGKLPDEIANWITAQDDEWFEAFISTATALPEVSASVVLPEVTDIRKALAKPHMLLLGETGSGKSTLVKFLVAHASAPAIVLDPHAAPDEWQNMNVIGAGRKYAAIGEEVAHLVQLMDARYEARSKGQKVFVPLLVVIDEFPAVVAALGKSFTESILLLVREARKIGIKLVILSQGAEVKTLGIEGQGSIRECFAVVSLGKFAIERARALRDEGIKAAISSAKYPVMLDDLPCALPEIEQVVLQRLPLPPDYQSLITAASTTITTSTSVNPLVSSESALPSLETDTNTYNSSDFQLADQCKSLLETGKSRTWIIENLLGYKGRNFTQGQQRLDELLQLAQ